MSHPQPLTSRLERLRRRLATHTARLDQEGGELIWAAVAAVLVPAPDAVLLIRRAERAGDPWSGHMALPGGRSGPEDADLVTTALRETREEVGLDLRREHLIGSVDDVVPRTPVLPPIAVRPYIFLLPDRPVLTPNPEVAATRWVLLDRLLDPETYQTVRIDIGGQSRRMPAYVLGDGIVWGMTERVITSLLTQVR